MTSKTAGFSGKILHVDLTSKDINIIPLDYSLVEQYIGGLGLCIKIAYDVIKPGTDPFDPDNSIMP